MTAPRHDFGSAVTVTIDDITGEHHVADDYVEMFWLPIVGPSCYCLARLLVTGTGATTWTLGALGARIGVLQPARVNHTLNRLVAFHWAQTYRDDPGMLLVHSFLPDVPARLLGRLPAELQAAHRTHSGQVA